jgi:ELWxxDGT repeat protein
VGGDTVFFTANDAIHGTELWKTNGSWAGTEMVEDILQGSEGSNPNYLTEFNGAIYFSAESDDTSGQVAMMANYEHLIWSSNHRSGTVWTLESVSAGNYIHISSKPIVTENELYFIGIPEYTTTSAGFPATILHHYHWEGNAMSIDVISGEEDYEYQIGGLLGSLDNTLYFKMKDINDFSYYKSPLDVYTMTVDN